MTTITQWIKKIEEQPSVTVHIEGETEGICKMHTGTNLLFAEVGLFIAPSDQLIFEMSLAEDDKKLCLDKGWFESICMGVLDVMLIGPPTPINKFKCIVKSIGYKNIHYQKMGFRLAARDAVQKFLSKQPFNRIWGCGYKE